MALMVWWKERLEELREEQGLDRDLRDSPLDEMERIGIRPDYGPSEEIPVLHPEYGKVEIVQTEYISF